FTPAAFTFISTSSILTAGFSRLVSFNTSGPPAWDIHIAFIIDSKFLCNYDAKKVGLIENCQMSLITCPMEYRLWLLLTFEIYRIERAFAIGFSDQQSRIWMGIENPTAIIGCLFLFFNIIKYIY